jgi:hypothetical protein
LDDYYQPYPTCEAISPKQQDMYEPHGVQYRDAYYAPLNRGVEGLIMWVRDYFGGKSGLPDRVTLK